MYDLGKYKQLTQYNNISRSYIQYEYIIINKHFKIHNKICGMSVVVYMTESDRKFFSLNTQPDDTFCYEKQNKKQSN